MSMAINAIILTVLVVVFACLFIYMFDSASRVIRRKDILIMNRQVMKYPEYSKGWLVLVDMNKKIVGLYNDQHSISHDRIYFGKELKDLVKSSGDDQLTLEIGDFRTLAVDIPRISYRVLYEYKVPHETKVIMYHN